MGNAVDGVKIINGSSGNLVGGTTAAARDIISANASNGVEIDGVGTSANQVVGDNIGTDASGTKALGNADSGVYLSAGSSSNTVGGTTAGTRNVISANGSNGVMIDTGSCVNTIAGNYIAANATGTMSLGNLASGVFITGGANSNLIGGTSGAGGNFIAYNNGDGVYIQGTSSTSNVVEYDTIEFNVGSGVYVFDAPGNGVFFCTIEYDSGYGILTVGSTTNLYGNTIAHNIQGQISQM